jgi:hypothetical protein
MDIISDFDGKPMYKCLSKRPGRNKAGSIKSGRDVAAITTISKKINY